MDGTRGNRSDLTIDGVPSTATANAGEVIASYVPPADIVQEFKVQTATFDASIGNTEGGVTNLMIKSGTNSLQRHRLLRQDAEGPVRERLLRQRQQHPARRLQLQPLRRHGRRADDPARLQRRRQHVLHVRLRGHPRVAAAQQRHADGADREDAQRRLLGAAGARPAVPDLQSVHAARRSAAAGSSRIRSPATSSRRT